MVHLTANIFAFFVILIQRILVSGAIVAACVLLTAILALAAAFAIRAIIRNARRDG